MPKTHENLYSHFFQYNRRLKRLNLSGNKFDEQGGKILAKCIGKFRF